MAGLERGVRPMGDWSMLMTLSRLLNNVLRLVTMLFLRHIKKKGYMTAPAYLIKLKELQKGEFGLMHGLIDISELRSPLSLDRLSHDA